MRLATIMFKGEEHLAICKKSDFFRIKDLKCQRLRGFALIRKANFYPGDIFAFHQQAAEYSHTIIEELAVTGRRNITGDNSAIDA